MYGSISAVIRATRIPGELRDRILIHPKADHMMVMVKQQFFPVRLFDAEGNIRHYMDLSAELDAIKNSAIDEAVNIGIMTGANRAWWAKTRIYKTTFKAKSDVF